MSQPKGYSTREFAEKLGVSQRRVRVLLSQGRIWPAEKVGKGTWFIYQNAVIVPPYERPNRKPENYAPYTFAESD